MIAVAACGSDGRSGDDAVAAGEPTGESASVSVPESLGGAAPSETTSVSTSGESAGTSSGELPRGAPARFEAMTGYEYGDEADHSGAAGMLLIEEPCVYLMVPLAGGPDETQPSERYLLRLPRAGTRYDPDAGALWVWDHGPFFAGDRVAVGGGGHRPDSADAAACSFDVIFDAFGVYPPEPLVAESSVAPTTQAESEQAGAVGAENGAAPADFEAMWDFEPDQEPMVDNALLGGVLVIEGSCVYLDVERPGEAEGETEPERFASDGCCGFSTGPRDMTRQPAHCGCGTEARSSAGTTSKSAAARAPNGSTRPRAASTTPGGRTP